MAETLETILKAKNDSEAAVRAYNDGLKSIAQQVKGLDEKFRELAKAEKEAQKHAQEHQGVVKNLDAVFGNFIGRNVDLNKEQKNLDQSLKATLGAFGLMAGAAAAAAVAVGAVAVQTAAYGSRLVDLNARTGATVEGLQKLEYASKLNGVSFDSVVSSFGRLSKAINDGNPALTRLGLSVRELQGMAPDQQFNAIAQAIAGIADPTQRAAAAMDVFGRAGAALLPLLTSNLAEAHVGSWQRRRGA